MRRWFKAGIYLLMVGLCAGAWAETIEEQEQKASFFDAEDGMLDMSEFLATAAGFLPVPILITEPAVGYGGGVALLFFHESIKDRAQKVKDAEAKGKTVKLAPPSISGAVGFGTENGTWGAGGFHMGIWKNDTIRYVGALFYADINLDYYGKPDGPLNGRSIGYNAAATILYQKLLFRMPKSNLFLGADYTFANTDMTLEVPIQGWPNLESTINEGGVGLIAQHDTRDNTFTPNKGATSELKFQRFDELFGGDFDHNKLLAKTAIWMPVHPKVVLGVRVDGQFSGGDTPFYMLPFVNLRGIPAMRYQGAHTFVAETEVRWDVTKRWSAVGFVGSGWVADNELNDFVESDAYVAAGVGFRYLVARAFNLRAGCDIARGPEDTAFYLTVGSNWR